MLGPGWSCVKTGLEMHGAKAAIGIHPILLDKKFPAAHGHIKVVP